MKDIRSYIRGSLLGEAIGDALGYPVEFTSQNPLRRAVFELEARNTDFDGRKCAFYSDDTQMTRAVILGLLDTPGVHTDFDKATANVAERFVQWYEYPDGGHRTPGGTCIRGVQRLLSGIEPLKAGDFNPRTGGGCGAVMRSAPYGWLWSGKPSQAAQAEEWAAKHATITHGAPIGQASSAALARMIAEATYTANPWLLAKSGLEAAQRYDEHTARMIAEAMFLASPPGQELFGSKIDCDHYVLDKFRGWAGHEAIAASIYCYLRFPTNFKEAVLLAVNSPGDSDSLGAITGSISGAFLGFEEIPKEWIEKIEKRDQLLELADRFVDILTVPKDPIESPPEKR